MMNSEENFRIDREKSKRNRQLILLSRQTIGLNGVSFIRICRFSLNFILYTSTN